LANCCALRGGKTLGGIIKSQPKNRPKPSVGCLAESNEKQQESTKEIARIGRQLKKQEVLYLGKGGEGKIKRGQEEQEGGKKRKTICKLLSLYWGEMRNESSMGEVRRGGGGGRT